jgi:hypothetical protein
MPKNPQDPKPVPPAKKERPAKFREIEPDASPLSIENIRGGTMNHILIKVVMFLLIMIFAVGFLFTSFNPGQGLGGGGAGGASQTVATVGSEAIDRARLEQVASRQEQMMAQYGMKVGPLEYFASRQRTLQSLIDNAALIEAARAAGLSVSDEEVDAEINKVIDEQIKQQKTQGEAAFRRAVEAQYGSVEKYREDMKNQLGSEREGFRKDLLVQKLEKKIKDENKVTEDDYKKSQTKLKIRQIMLRPALAPANDKTLTEKNLANAKTKAEKLVEQLKKTPTPQNFAALAKQNSDDLATKDKGGDLGWKLPAELPVSPVVKDAILQSNEKIIGPVADEASNAVYIFMVEDRALRLPADYAKNKAKLLADFETAQDNEAWQKYQAEISKAAKFEISDPALQAYKIQSEQIAAAPAAQQNQLRQDALAKYEAALPTSGGIEAAAIRYQMAQLYHDLKQPKKAAEVLKVASEETANAPALDLEYARALREAGDKKAAVTQLQKVSKEMDEAPPSPPSMFGGNPDDAIRFQISNEFESLGRKDLAEAERKKIKPQGGMPGGMMMPGSGMTAPSAGADPHAGHNHP